MTFVAPIDTTNLKKKKETPNTSSLECIRIYNDCKMLVQIVYFI